ncbi:hypothetical protein K5F93_11915 [Pseudomonas protegens]|uniref:hypothetical protein n=1 Tax=Pseudomonas protegens TaxID=380021 RepID=UPI001C8D2F31|nr:hypothetical protein [Pseudomonas protegens]QZI72914.1 hypothetical protein K5F93_11915 [Pseudomonas protegens]
MNRQQIATAHHLLWTRDQVQGRLDTVLGGSGVALMISGQGYPEALAAVTDLWRITSGKSSRQSTASSGCWVGMASRS